MPLHNLKKIAKQKFNSKISKIRSDFSRNIKVKEHFSGTLLIK